MHRSHVSWRKQQVAAGHTFTGRGSACDEHTYQYTRSVKIVITFFTWGKLIEKCFVNVQLSLSVAPVELNMCNTRPIYKYNNDYTLWHDMRCVRMYLDCTWALLVLTYAIILLWPPLHYLCEKCRTWSPVFFSSVWFVTMDNLCKSHHDYRFRSPY